VNSGRINIPGGSATIAVDSAVRRLVGSASPERDRADHYEQQLQPSAVLPECLAGGPSVDNGHGGSSAAPDSGWAWMEERDGGSGLLTIGRPGHSGRKRQMQRFRNGGEQIGIDHQAVPAGGGRGEPPRSYFPRPTSLSERDDRWREVPASDGPGARRIRRTGQSAGEDYRWLQTAAAQSGEQSLQREQGRRRAAFFRLFGDTEGGVTVRASKIAECNDAELSMVIQMIEIEKHGGDIGLNAIGQRGGQRLGDP